MALFLHSLACFCLAYGLEFTSISPDWTNEYHSSRATWTGLRLAVHYNDTLPCPYLGQCPDMDLTSLKDQVVPTAVEWFQKVLKVPSLSGPLKVPLAYCGQVVVPEEHRSNGVMSADTVIYIATVPLSIHKYDLKSYGTACLLSAERPNRVVAGTIWLTMDWFSTLTYQRQVDLVSRHIAQILGFDPLLFSSFTKPDDSYYDHKEIITNDTMAGKTVYLLTLPTVVNKAKETFNCPLLKGVQLEGQYPDDRSRQFYAKNYVMFGSNFTSFLSLWSGRMMLNDFMSDLIVSDKASYSDVTMAVFEDSGWYSVDWKYTSVAAYGYKRGCDFFYSHCGNETEWTGFCENGSQACSPDLTLKGNCKEICSVLQPFKFTGPLLGGNPAMDFCPIIETGTSCLYGEVEVDWEEKCENCRCFAWNLTATETHCHRITCGNLSANVTVGNKVITCPPEGGSVSVEGFTGLINCPPFHQLCVPLSSPTLCIGQDNCLACPPGHHAVNGQCEPISRVLYECSETCASCSGPGDNECLSCYGNALLPESPGRCICPNNTSTQCTHCHPHCLTCNDEDPFYCLTCHANARLDALSHTCECALNSYPDPDSSNCQLCNHTCNSCTGPGAKQCDSCNLDIFDMLQNGECVCNDKRYSDATEVKCINCSLHCDFCTSSTCITCSPRFTINTTDFSCNINDGFYWDEAKQEALPCPDYCKHCSLTSNQTLACLECMDTFVWQEDETCGCVVGFSVDQQLRTCQKCGEDSCLTCAGYYGYWPCKTCIEGYHIVWLYQPPWGILDWCYPCGDGYYMSLNATCEKCSFGCKYCLGPDNNECSMCFESHTLIGTQCLCPSRTFPNPDVSNCTACHNLCRECNGPNETNCTSCFDDLMVRLDGSCGRICDPTCATCHYSYNDRSCDTCNNLFDLYDGVCQCPIVNGKYEVRSDCRCGWECSSCDGQGGCTWCSRVGLRFNETDHMCRCGTKTYPNPDIKNCSLCDITCQECWGPNNTQCTVCRSDLIRVEDGLCLCPYGSDWKNYATCYAPNFLCSDQFCDNCKNGGLREDMYFAEAVIGYCHCGQPDSGIGVYFDSMAGTCHLCFPLCTSCARDRQVCSSCIPSAVFTPMALDSVWGSCMCPRGTFYEVYSRDSGSCIPCSTGCLSCLSKIACDACQYGFTLTKAVEGPIYCSCAASLCGCPLGTYELTPIMSCEYFCPTGYLAMSRTCLESTPMLISFTFTNYTKSFLPSKSKYIAQLGSANIASIETDPESPIPMHPGNLYFGEDKQSRVVITPVSGQDTLVLAPTFYIEFWQKGNSLISATRPGSFLFSSSHTSIFLVAKNATNQTFEWTYAPLNFQNWSLVRYEVKIFSQNQTIVSIYLNNTSVFSQSVEDFFYRDSVFYTVAAELLTFESNHIEAYMGPLVVSNSMWKQAICQAGGSGCVLAECGYKQFRDGNGVCQACQDTCFYGCVQASDCRLPKDMLCLNFSHNLVCETCVQNAKVINGNCKCQPPARLEASSCPIDYLCETFKSSSSSECTKCKIKAYFSLNICHCIANSTYSETPQACSCLPHYAYNGTNCLFDPDPLCATEGSYTSCSTCKSLSTLQIGGTCACIGNSTFAASTQECVCNERFEPNGTECVFIEDPMCLKYGEAYNCKECKTLSYSNQGNCTCIPDAHFVSNSCECNTHYKQNGAICVHIEDPLCGEYETNGQCAYCKAPSQLLNSSFCGCSLHSHISDSQDSCICDTHYVETNGICEFDVDPICNYTGEYTECPQCYPFALLNTAGYCFCQSNMQFSSSESKCVCNRDYTPEGDICIYNPDPVCKVPEAINCYKCVRSRVIEITDNLCKVSNISGCQECVELARLEQGSCRCVNGAKYVNSSCSCAPGYFSDNHLCIPNIDPLCLNETATPCQVCKQLSTQVNGICQCTPHSRYNYTTHICACLPKFASYNNNTCIDTSADLLCLAYDLSKKCISCKEKAKPVAGVCACVGGANFFSLTATCKCRNRYTPTLTDCVFQSNPLCTKYESDQCTVCTSLSAINATGECSCVKNAVLSASGTACQCAFHYRQSGNACLFDPDPLCTAYWNTTNCTSCKTFSQLNNTTGYCNCSKSYLYSASLIDCTPCDAYFSPDEVSATIQDMMSSIVITFNSTVNRKDGCQSRFDAETWSKFGPKSNCPTPLSTNQTQFVKLDSGTLLTEGYITLISSNLLKLDGDCVLPTQLKPYAKYVGAPNPFTSCPLEAPIAFPLMCSQSSLTISFKSNPGGLGTREYQWTLNHSSQGIIMPQYHVWSTAFKITMNSTDLIEGVLHVEGNIRDRMSQTCANVTSITLKNDVFLQLRFDLGILVNFISQDQGDIKVFVMDSCGATGLKIYVWSFIGAEPPLPANDRRPYDILRVSKVPYALAIPRKSLGVGYRYTYRVVVRQGILSGTANITLFAQYSPLNIRLNRIGGKHSIDMTLTMSTILSTDPDNLPGSISTQWNCVATDGLQCKNSKGSSLLTSAWAAATSFSISPDLLQLNANYTFTATITKGSRVASQSVSIVIVQTVGCNMVLTPIFKVCNTNKYFYIAPIIQTLLEIQFRWTQTSNLTTVPCTAPTASFLAFSPNTLSDASFYHYELIATTPKGTMSMQVDFYVNGNPSRGRVDVSPSTGTALSDVFSMSTTGWSDYEENYPLSYQFCCVDAKEKEICFTGLSFVAYSERKVYWGCVEIRAKAVDTVGGEGQASAPVDIAPFTFLSRALTASTLTLSFLDDVNDPENVLSMVIVYSKSIPVDQSLYVAMISAMRNYTETLFQVTPQLMSAILGAQRSLAEQNITKTANNGEELLLLLNQTLSEYVEEITYDQLYQIFEIAAVAGYSSPGLYNTVINTAISQYYIEKLPSETGFHFFNSEYEYFTFRQVSALYTSISLQYATITLPTDWINSEKLLVTDILDLHFTVNVTQNSTEMSILMRKSGTYLNYNVLLEPGETLNRLNATAAYNVSLAHYLGNETLECLGRDSHNNWTTSLCSILSVSNTTVNISTTSLTSFLVCPVPISPPLPPDDPIAISSNLDTDNSVNPAPVVISFVLSLAGIVAFLVFRRANRNKYRIACESHIRESPKYTISDTIRAHEEGKAPINDQIIEFPPKTTDREQLQIKEQIEPRESISPPSSSYSPFDISDSYRSVRALHMLLGLPERPGMAAELVCTLLTDILVLGVCYRCSLEGEQTASTAREVFARYSWEDVKFVGVAVAFGTMISCFSLLRKPAIPLCSAVISLLECGAVLYLNLEAGYEEGGRWAISVLVALGVQSVLETVKCLVAVEWTKASMEEDSIARGISS